MMKSPVDIQRPATPPDRVWVTKWIASDGEFVKENQIICEIESEKAIYEIPAPCDGILRQLAQPMAKLDFCDLVGRIEPA